MVLVVRAEVRVLEEREQVEAPVGATRASTGSTPPPALRHPAG
jgi:hypothetical protein